MPLDTRLVITISSEGSRNQYGEYVPGDDPVEYPVWADVSSGGSSEFVQTGGSDIRAGMAVTVRWFRQLALAPIRLVFITDALGQRWEVDNIGASDQRRRWLGMSAYRYESDPEGDG